MKSMNPFVFFYGFKWCLQNLHCDPRNSLSLLVADGLRCDVKEDRLLGDGEKPKKLSRWYNLIWVCLKIGYIPNEIAIFHRDNDH